LNFQITFPINPRKKINIIFFRGPTDFQNKRPLGEAVNQQTQKVRLYPLRFLIVISNLFTM